MANPKYKSYEDCLAKNQGKGDGAAEFCRIAMQKPVPVPSNTTRANLIISGIRLTPVTNRDTLKIDVLATTELSELMSFRGAVLARSEINANRDELRPRDIDMLADTLPSMPVTLEHQDQVIIGYITAAHSRERSSVLTIDGVIYAKRFPEAAKDIQSGAKKLSVEADADSASCSKCHGVFASQDKYCEHLQPVANRFTHNSYRTFPDGVRGVGAGVVKDPAGTNTGFNQITMIAAMDTLSPNQVDPTDVRLRSAQTESVSCGACQFFNPPNNTCERVQGWVAKNQVCDLFQSKSDEEIDMTEEALNAALAAALAPVQAKLQAAEDAAKDEKAKNDQDKDDMKATLAKLQADYLNTPNPEDNSEGARELPVPTEPNGTGAKPSHVTIGKPDGLDAARTVVKRIAAVTAMVGPTVAEAVAEGISSMTSEQYDALTQIVAALRNTPPMKAHKNGVSRDGISVLSTIAGQYNENNDEAPFAGTFGKAPY